MLRYLATGNSFSAMPFYFMRGDNIIGENCVGKIGYMEEATAIFHAFTYYTEMGGKH
jgi:hypothetical protein